MNIITISQFYSKYKGKYVTAYGGVSKTLQWNNPFGGQCASLVRQYLVQCFGYVDRPYGNGKDFVNIPKGKRVKVPRDGDIIVFPYLTKWGHVAIYYKGKMMEQNPKACGLRTIYSGTKIYIRPHQYKKAKPVKKGKLPSGFTPYKVKLQVTASNGLNVRLKPRGTVIANKKYKSAIIMDGYKVVSNHRVYCYWGSHKGKMRWLYMAQAQMKPYIRFMKKIK